MRKLRSNETVVFILKLVLLLVFGLGFASVLESQNTVISNGRFNEAYDMNVVSDITIGNNCNVANFINIYYDGNFKLKNNVYINNAVLTVYGSVNYNNYNVHYSCNISELIVEPTLTIGDLDFDKLKLYPNPTKGMFFLSTKKKFKIRVYDIRGRHLTDFPDLRCFPSGIYLVNININNIETNKKIIKI